MRLIEQKAELLIQPKGLNGLEKQIEIAARTCYKSENNSTGDSKSFVDKLVKMKHFSMLEQGTVYLKFDQSKVPDTMVSKYYLNPYSRAKFRDESGIAYITTNYRVLLEHGWTKDLQYWCEPTNNHVKRYTFRLTTSIGIVRELLRHRVFSFANESTRYCRYTDDRFGNEITYIIPHWLDVQEGKYTFKSGSHYLFTNILCNGDKVNRIGEKAENFILNLSRSEYTYNHLLEEYSPQQAREVLPLCTKSELIMTGFEDDWKNFLDVRLKGTTGKPHPDMVELAQLIEDELCKVNKVIKIETIHESSFDDATEYNNEFPSLKDTLDKQKKLYEKEK